MPPDDRLSMAEQLSAAWDKQEAEAGDAGTERSVGETTAPDGAAESRNADGQSEGARAGDDGRSRDDSGRFAKEPREKLTLKLKEVRDAAPHKNADGVDNRPDAQVRTADAQGAKAQDGTVPQVAQDAKAGNGAVQAQPPLHWLGAAKKHWDRLPAEVRESIAADGQKVAAVEGLGRVVEPYAQRFQQEFGGSDRAIGVILDAWKFARQSPVDFVKQFLQHNNIDPRTLAGEVQQFQPQQGIDPNLAADPALAPVLQRMQQLETVLQQVQQQPVIAQQNQITSEIEAFRADPAHPYFNDVRPVMGALMASGQAMDLKKAYEMACRAHPVIHAEMMKEQATKQAEQRKAATEKAQRAGGSITGSPGVARSETHVKQSARADLLKNWDALEARV